MGIDIILYSHLKFQDRRLESDGTMCSKTHPNEQSDGTPSGLNTSQIAATSLDGQYLSHWPRESHDNY
ncbi:hypothetical protein TNCV_625401 [Trichonephila clavipes]|nr:hypothetical protein TNCV_625401 [Trichonephila clavipes]